MYGSGEAEMAAVDQIIDGVEVRHAALLVLATRRPTRAGSKWCATEHA
jgi:hypothetical protein